MAEQNKNGGGEKTEKPTPKKLRDSAKEGDILQSKELAIAMVVMAGAAWMAVAGPMIMRALQDMLINGLRFSRDDIMQFEPAQRTVALSSGIVIPIGGIMLATIIAAIATPAMLGSLGFRANAFKFKASKLNPGSGLKRMFGMNGLIELVKSIAKVVLLGAIGFWLIWDKLAQISAMGTSGLHEALIGVGNIFILACLVMGGALFIVAGIDVPSQIMQRGKRLRMSIQDIKDEHKQTEGSPELKAHIRRKQFEVLNGSMKKAVSEASVVLMNPTHFAVALRYNPLKGDTAPIVVARGCDAIALAIRDFAETQDVTVMEYPQLARAVYFTSRVGQVVDEALYMAVATVLAFLFRVENKMSSMRDRPHIELPDDMLFDGDGKKAEKPKPD